MILLARDILGGEPDGRIGLMDLTVQRNAFGRQVDSFETDLPFEGIDHPIHAVFIRAPLVERVGAEADALATLARRPRRRRPPGQSPGDRVPPRAHARHAPARAGSSRAARSSGEPSASSRRGPLTPDR